jgi:cation transport regulator ChaC
MAERIQLNPRESAIFGYGSLLLKSSMERTLGRPYDRDRYTCHVSGWRRRWDSLYPNESYYYVGAAGEKVYPKNILYLNISRSDAALNGVLYIIDDAEVATFDKREAVYDRVDVRDQVTDVEIIGGAVWAYVGKPAHVLTAAVSAREAAVRQSYIHIVESGLKELGPTFSAEYRRSTDLPPEANIIDDRID